jgi:exopolyphosphatase/guanosine-5'-triphosphate,3'-diphosphate pyrophosphatase
LREGIIFNALAEYFDNQPGAEKHGVRFNSVSHLAEISNFDREHCANVAKLSLKLFDELKPLHKLPDLNREYLEAAALLHDIGYHISYGKHHKHSYYIIRNSGLLGFNDMEILVIANIARYHRKSHPKPGHAEFSSLPDKQKNVVKILAAILRVADSLDRKHSGTVEEIGIHSNDSDIKFLLNINSDNIDIELWSLERRKALFEEVFGKKLVVEVNNKQAV